MMNSLVRLVLEYSGSNVTVPTCQYALVSLEARRRPGEPAEAVGGGKNHSKQCHK